MVRSRRRRKISDGSSPPPASTLQSSSTSSRVLPQRTGVMAARTPSSATTSGNLPVQSFGRYCDLFCHSSPLALCGKIAIVPGQPGIEPGSDCTQGYDFGALSGTLQLPRKVPCPFQRKDTVVAQQPPDFADRDRDCFHCGRGDGVAVVMLRKQRRFRQYRAGRGALEDSRTAMLLIADQVRTSIDHDENHLHRIASVEEVFVPFKGSMRDGLRPKDGENFIRHDSYHVHDGE